MTLHRISEAYGGTPATIAGINDEWAAFQFNAAALALGRKVDHALQENSALKKSARRPASEVVDRALGDEPESSAYRLPTGVKARVVRPGDEDFDEWAALYGKQANAD